MEIHPKSTRYHYVWVARQIKNLLQRSATTDRKEASNSQKDGGSARDPQIPEPRTTRPPPRTRLRAGDPPKWRANAGCAKTYIPSSPRIRCILRRCTSLVAFLLMDTPSAAGYAVCRRIRRLPQDTPSAAGYAVCRRTCGLPQDTPSAAGYAVHKKQPHQQPMHPPARHPLSRALCPACSATNLLSGVLSQYVPPPRFIGFQFLFLLSFLFLFRFIYIFIVHLYLYFYFIFYFPGLYFIFIFISICILSFLLLLFVTFI